MMEPMDESVSARTHGLGREPPLLEALLSKLALFDQVEQAQIGSLALLSTAKRLRRGAMICRRGERLTGVIALGYGVMKVALRRRDGEEKVVRFMGANETFGECAVLLDVPSPVDVVALEESVVAEIPSAPLLRLLERDLRFSNNFSRAVAGRFLNLLAEHNASIQQNAQQRIAAYLMSIVAENVTRGMWIARLPASKTAVAARIGITKETFSRQLRDLIERELIAVVEREIEVLDLSAMMKLAR
jgi:CRP-like cAMP-binding protein